MKDYTQEERDVDVARVRNAVSVLGEHFDNVQVFCSYNPTMNDTRFVEYGAGNSFARVEQVRRWVDRIDMNVRSSHLNQGE